MLGLHGLEFVTETESVPAKAWPFWRVAGLASLWPADGRLALLGYLAVDPTPHAGTPSLVPNLNLLVFSWAASDLGFHRIQSEITLHEKEELGKIQDQDEIGREERDKGARNTGEEEKTGRESRTKSTRK